MKKIVIAIDGHSSSGKSTMAKDLAKEIGYTYIDTGRHTPSFSKTTAPKNEYSKPHNYGTPKTPLAPVKPEYRQEA